MGSTCSLCLTHSTNNNTPTSTIIICRNDGEDLLLLEETTSTKTNINRKVYASSSRTSIDYNSIAGETNNSNNNTTRTSNKHPLIVVSTKSSEVGITATIIFKSLQAIISNNENVNDIRRKACTLLQKLHASESIEFIYEIQNLVQVNDVKERHYALNYIMREFILPEAPREICVPGDKRDLVMRSWNNSDDEVLYSLLYRLAFGEVYFDVIQNPVFQKYIAQLVEEGIIHVMKEV
jgi:TATA-box binding protein (TBP) (component of TFIID and TFIIIB)